MSKSVYISLLIPFLILAHQAFAQELDSADLKELQGLKAETESSELQKKLNENVAAASKKALSSRETPGIVSIITEDDIRKNGSRDLMDVLRLVPGFDFAADVNFVTGLSLRGAWSLEGKILVLMDGQELNDLMYQNVAFFNRFPVDLIHRIEIIRGPGSAVYGGTAEYGVINIITKGASENEGVTASALYGALPNSYGRKNAQVSVIKKFGDKSSMDVSFYRGQAIKSDQDYQDLYQADPVVNLTDITETNTSYANVGLKIHNLSIRGLYENYMGSDPNLSVEFKNFFLTVKNEFNINPTFKLTPFLYYTKQTPWKQVSSLDNSPYFDNDTHRIKGGIFGSYDVSRRVNLILGSEYFQDYAKSRIDPTYFNGNEDIRFNLYSLYAQALVKHPFVNITGGFRFDKHNAFGAAFVPRIALTKRFGNFHFKTLASGSYRAPGIDNINLGTNIKPERSTVYEVELGYQLTKDMLLSVNAYEVKTKDIIVYFYTDLGGGNYSQGYENNTKFGTQGIEVSYMFKRPQWSLESNYSFYKAGKSTVDRYAIPGNPNAFVGIPQGKFVFMGNVTLVKDLSLNMTITHVGKRNAYTQLDINGFPETTELDPYTLLQSNLSYNNLFTPGLFLSFGAFDILNQKPVIPQAYNGDFAPLSGRSREFVIKLAYSIPFQSKK